MATEYKIANFNIMSWQDTDYDRNVNPTPLDVSVPKMLTDGTIVYTSVPNLAKKKSEVDTFISEGASTFPAVNLYKNSQFLREDSAIHALPDSFSTFFAYNSPTYTIVSPNASATVGTDEEIASRVVALFCAVDWFPSIYKVLKVTLTKDDTQGSHLWSLNQTTNKSNGVYSRGAYAFMNMGSSSNVPIAYINDNPGGADAGPIEITNTPFKIYGVGHSSGRSLGFNVRFDLVNFVDGETVDVFVAGAWFCNGKVENHVCSPNY